MNTHLLTGEPQRLLYLPDGSPYAEFIDSFVTGEAYTEQASFVIFRLAMAEKEARRGADPVPAADARQFAISAKRARALARELLRQADQLDGVDHQRQ